MKNASKRLLSFALCLVLLAGLFPPLSAQGEESAKNQISTVEIVEEKVRVGYSATESAELVVAFYADPGAEDAPVLQLLATVTGEAEPELTKVSLDLPLGLPDYFALGAYLLRSGTHEPLCEEYVSSLYTQRYQEFIHAPLAEFEDRGERLLILAEGEESDGSDASFVVFAEDVVLVKETEEFNHLTENEDGSFSFSQPGPAMLALQAGDKLGFTDLEGSVNVLLVQSCVLDEETNTLTLTMDEDADVPVFFDTVRVSAAGDPNAPAQVDMSTAAPGVEYLPDEDISGEVEQIIAQVEAGGEAPLYAGTDEAVVMGAPSDAKGFTISHKFTWNLWSLKKGAEYFSGEFFGKITAEPGITVKYYLKDDINYFSVKVGVVFSANIGVKGTLGGDFPLGDIAIPTGVPGTFVVIHPEFVAKFTASITLVLKTEVSVGIEYDDTRPKGDYWHPIQEYPKEVPKGKIVMEGKLSLGFRLRLRVEVSLTRYLDTEMFLDLSDSTALKSLKKKRLLMAGLSASALVEFSGKMEFPPPWDEDDSASEVHVCKQCIDGSVDLVLSMGYEASALYGMIDGSDDSAISSPIHLGNFYVSLDTGEFGKGRCPNRRFKLSVSAIDGIDYGYGDLAFRDYEQIIKDNDKVHRVVGAVVNIRSKSGNYIQTEDLITGEDGTVFTFVPVGEYEIRVFSDAGYGETTVLVEDSAREARVLLI